MVEGVCHAQAIRGRKCGRFPVTTAMQIWDLMLVQIPLCPCSLVLLFFCPCKPTFLLTGFHLSQDHATSATCTYTCPCSPMQRMWSIESLPPNTRVNQDVSKLQHTRLPALLLCWLPSCAHNRLWHLLALLCCRLSLSGSLRLCIQPLFLFT